MLKTNACPELDSGSVSYDHWLLVAHFLSSGERKGKSSNSVDYLFS